MLNKSSAALTLSLAALLAAGLMPFTQVRAADPATGPAPTAADDDDTPPDEEQPKPDPDKKPPPLDPSDIRNSIGNLNTVRGFNQLAKPKPTGLWQKLVDQPYYTPAVRARKLLFFGQYTDAETRYSKLLKDEPNNSEYLEGYLEAILSQGHASNVESFNTKYNQLNAAQQGTPKMTRLRAQALIQSGQRPAAQSLLKTFVDNHPKIEPEDGETIATYMMYAEALEQAAEYAAANGIYLKLAPLVEGKWPEDSQAATQLSLAVYRSARLTGNAKDKNRSVLYELSAVLQNDQNYWPAMRAEAEILVAAHNDNDAGKTLDGLLGLNPNELEAKFLTIDHTIGQYNFEGARDVLTDLKASTDSAEVDAYEGRLLLKERVPEKAIAPLLQAIKKDPHLPEARGWLAGAYYLTNQKEKMTEQLNALKVGNGADAATHPVTLFEAAEILRDARQFTQAEQLYLQSQAAARWWSEPPAALGELYLEMGEEAKAKASFELAGRIDPYNLRAVNQMTLLDMLQKFKVKESHTRLAPGSDKPAFIVRYSPDDEILADLVIEWMEKVRPEVWSYFHVTSMVATTQIELFPSHEEFSVRTTGLPWIGTVGASTGSVIAMDVPRGGAKNLMGAFDWARVLRHEYTHTVTLATTNNRIPHWLTEAAAVEQEQSPRDWENAQLLCSNYRADTLFKIADLNWGFIKPKRSIDRQLAYFQSQWIYEYLVETYGQDKMLAFLECFRDGLVEPEAWKKTYSKTMEEMDTEFHAWAGKQLDSWGLPFDPLPKQADVEAALKKDPKDPVAMYNQASIQASAGNLPGARKSLEDLLAIDPKHVKGRELLGALLYQMSNAPAGRGRGPAPEPGLKDKAKDLLEAVVQDDPKRPVALRTLGLMAMSKQDYDAAEKWFLKLQEVRPLDETSYSSLAGIYLLRKDNDKAVGQLLEMQRHEQKNELIPRKLADLYMQAKKLADAETSAYRAVRINPYNAINHELLAQVLDAENKPKEAVEYWTYATDLQPKIAEFWEGLADAQGAQGNKPAAADAAKKALEIQPDSKAAKWLK